MKKPALITVFVTAVFLLFTSCSNLFQALGIENSSGKGSLRVVLPEASPQTGRSVAGASRLAVNTDDIKTYTIIVIKDGVVIAEQTAAAGSSVTFSDIEEGTYTIRGSAYDGRARLAYGSITARVLAGKTTNAAFPMYTTPPIILWNYKAPDNDMSVYIADTATRSLYGMLPHSVPKSLDVMEFDASRNLYTNKHFLSAASGYNPVELGNKIKFSPPPTNLTLDYIYCSEDNILFTVKSGSLYFCDPSSEDSFGKSEAIGILDGGGIIGSGEFMAVSRAGADNSRFLYNIKYDDVNNLIEIEKYKISQTCDSDGKSISMANTPPPILTRILLGDKGYEVEVVSEISIQDDPSNPHSSIQISLNRKGSPRVTDVRIREDEMYILFSYDAANGWSPSSYDNYISSGALLKVKLATDGTPSRDEDFGEEGALGWTYKLTSPLVFESLHNFYGQWPSDENKGFFGPRKILALKSKKIWIADDGAIYENKKGSGKGAMVQKDRVVVVDLERESFESVYSFDGIGFSNTVKGSGF